jgi:hypothetical protein
VVALTLRVRFLAPLIFLLARGGADRATEAATYGPDAPSALAFAPRCDVTASQPDATKNRANQPGFFIEAGFKVSGLIIATLKL